MLLRVFVSFRLSRRLLGCGSCERGDVSRSHSETTDGPGTGALLRRSVVQDSTVRATVRPHRSYRADHKAA